MTICRVGTLMMPPQSSGAVAGSLSIVAGPTDAIFTGYPTPFQEGGSIFMPAVKANGHQWLYEFSSVTGALLDSLDLSDAYNGVQDDHSGSISAIITPDGAKLTAYAGHATDSVVRFRRSSNGTLDGFGAEYTKSLPDVTTYPQLFVQESTGNIYCIVRVTNFSWYIMESTDDGLTWGTPAAIISSSNQMYVNPRWLDANRLLIVASDNPNLGTALPYICTVNVSTGALVSGSGTISNYLTSTPKQTASMSDLTLFYDPGGTKSSGAGNGWDLFGGVVIGVNYADGQYKESWYCTPPTDLADIVTPAEWTFTKICDLGYGTGATAGTPYQYKGEGSLSLETGLTKPRFFCSRQFLGTWRIVQMDCATADGTGAWTETMYFTSRARGATELLGRPQGFENSDGKVKFVFVDGTFSTYTNFDTDYGLAVATAGGTAPTLLSSSTIQHPEYRALQITPTFDQPCGIAATGGADQAKFFVHGDSIYLEAKSFATPEDANTDNVYAVQITATSGSGLQTVINYTVEITSSAVVASNLLTKTHLYENAAWTENGFTPDDATGDTLDPFGGSNACKLVSTATTVLHRTEQNETLGTSAIYTNSQFIKRGANANFVLLRQTTGGNGVAGALFDILRGNYLGPLDGGLTILSWGIYHDPAWEADWWRLWMTYTSPGTVSGGAFGIILSQYAKPTTVTELQSTGIYVYAYGSQINAGYLADYQDVA